MSEAKLRNPERNSGIRRVSIIINTDGRAHTIRTTLSSLFHINYPSFEVCVVVGPTEDGTRELLSEFANKLKLIDCPVRNLSVSRNLALPLHQERSSHS